MRHHLRPVDIIIFQQKLAVFAILGNEDKNYILIHNL